VEVGTKSDRAREVAVTVTHAGTSSVRPWPSIACRTRRQGPGRHGDARKDFVTHIFVANTHAPLLFFSSIGMVYRLKVWRLPEARIQGRGKAHGESASPLRG